MTSKYDEKILESFLEELLGDKQPPDLSARILKIHQAESGQVKGPSNRPKFKTLDQEVLGGNIEDRNSEKRNGTTGNAHSGNAQTDKQVSPVHVASKPKTPNKKTAATSANNQVSSNSNKSVLWIVGSLAALMLIAATVAIAFMLSRGNDGPSLVENENLNRPNEIAENENSSPSQNNDPVNPWDNVTTPEDPSERAIAENDPGADSEGQIGNGQNESDVANNSQRINPADFPILAPGELVKPPAFDTVANNEQALDS